ncbi:hypothetical protein GH714_037903 [Hevea brasiliensis]|uniref:RST domain-containing protein n=1 Tax=Hevea brasiliensis TaxID=3981 RepID=A0A6A6K8H9_HEVBR|nr:hypothetical protein GH714_037903 [Hevea brasiliensis]
MDPSIMKLLEEDEDETMHSGADVEAFQAALNRDIGGDASSSQRLTPQFCPMKSIKLLVSHFQIGKLLHNENANGASQQQQQQEQHSSAMELKQHVSTAENQQLHNDATQESSHLLLHEKQPQDDVQEGQAKQIPLQTPRTTGMQISERNPMPLSEREKMQNPDTESQYMKVNMEQFVRLMRNIVGDQVLRLAVAQLQSQPGSNQSQLQSQAFARQHNVRMPVSASASSAVQALADSSYPSAENNAQKSREVERQPDSHGMQVSKMPSSTASIVNQDRERSSISVPGHSKQQQHLHFPPTSFPMYGSNSATYHPYSGTNVNTSGSSMKPQSHDLQMRQISHQTMGTTQIGGSTQAMNMMNVPKFERQNSVADPNRVQSGSISQYTNKSALQQSSVPWQAPMNKEQSSAPFLSTNYGNAVPGNSKDVSLEKQSAKVGFSAPIGLAPSNSVSPSISTPLEPNVQVGSRIPSVAASAGVNARTPPKKPSIGQKKPLEALGSSPPMASKKQKVSGAFSDQSIEQLNDVTAVSGVNLREEEEQLFSGSKEESRVSEASRKVVQEEEKVAKCGLKNINNDVERCLSLCVEERMRGLISKLIRLSKQRVDAEKSRHRTVITSDVRQQIMAMNRKAREEWEKSRQKLKSFEELMKWPEGDNGVEVDKEKDEGRMKSVKKREGGTEATSSSQSSKEKSLSTTGRNIKDNQEPEKRSSAFASRAVRKIGRNQSVPQVRVAHSISVKDVIAALEREPQMSKSTLIYQLYERIRSDSPAE